ncbi:leukocyte-associated immunoglobulin-like receptor 2 isoform X2 [Saccopteryx bilineata]|uniref:leukocyte-associated immunoglobulin-like receptor 2 isoform X2 n=1 Tax=Saccopteryx bilineata TaxID=59482 RepID=UPI00338ED980
MFPRPTALLGLGVPPTPSIRAEPGSVIPQGRPVTIVCQGPKRAEVFRLEDKDGRTAYKYDKIEYQRGSQGTEARFRIPTVTEDTAGPYRCLYHLHGTHTWSLRSEPLELKVTGLPSKVTIPPTETGPQKAPASRNYTVRNCVHISLAAAVLLILMAILAEAWHSQRRSPHAPQGWRQDDTH